MFALQTASPSSSSLFTDTQSTSSARPTSSLGPENSSDFQVGPLGRRHVVPKPQTFDDLHDQLRQKSRYVHSSDSSPRSLDDRLKEGGCFFTGLLRTKEECEKKTSLDKLRVFLLKARIEYDMNIYNAVGTDAPIFQNEEISNPQWTALSVYEKDRQARLKEGEAQGKASRKRKATDKGAYLHGSSCPRLQCSSSCSK